MRSRRLSSLVLLSTFLLYLQLKSDLIWFYEWTAYYNWHRTISHVDRINQATENAPYKYQTIAWIFGYRKPIYIFNAISF